MSLFTYARWLVILVLIVGMFYSGKFQVEVLIIWLIVSSEVLIFSVSRLLDKEFENKGRK